MYRIGVDLGGTNIAAGVVNENYQIVRKASVPTAAATRSATEIALAIAELCKRLCDECEIPLSAIEAIGIAAPGAADSVKGRVEYANNLKMERFPICEVVAEATGIANVHVENDANAAAFGEAVAGAARGTANSVMITLGTGVGGGIIIDGKVYSGSNFAGAELGHIVIDRNGPPCTCGRRGCWEVYSSATGLIRMTKEKLEECHAAGRATLMDELVAKRGKVSGRVAFDAMRAGDEAGKEVVDTYLSYLATGLTDIINIFRPEVLLIGGGVANEKEELLRPLRPLVERECYGHEFFEPTKIRTAELGNDAGIIGAAMLGK